MTDPADRSLEERLHALTRAVSVPIVPPADDVRRGRRRLFRLRVAMGGATTATLAVVLGITSLTAGDPKANEAPEITQPPSTAPTTPSSTPSTETGQDGDAGAQRGGEGAGAGIGAASRDDPSRAGTDATGTDGPPTGIPVKNAPSGGSTTQGGADPGHHQASDDPDPTETPTSTPTSTPTETSTGTPTTNPTTNPTADPTADPTSEPTVPPTGATNVHVHEVLRYYNDVLADHLDRLRSHLQPYDRAVDAKRVTTADGQIYALGSTFRWANGRSVAGLGIVVASGWDQLEWGCGAYQSDWSCHLGASDEVEVARHDGLLEVAVEHPSGQVVVLTAGPAADSVRRGARGVDASEADLAAAAGDDRLILPGLAPVAPPRIDVGEFGAAGLAALVESDETFQQTGLDRSPWVRGDWTGSRGQHGSLSWTAQPIYSGGTFTCLTTYRSCTDVVVDTSGTTVHLALLKAQAGGGWLVQYDGAAYGVRAYSSTRAFPKKRAFAFVTQQAWQPARQGAAP